MAEETGMGEKQAKPETRMEGAISESAGQINEVGRAVKILEDKYTNLRADGAEENERRSPYCRSDVVGRAVGGYHDVA